MAVITEIVESARRPGRFDVRVDGRSAATVSVEIVDRLRLAVGRVVDEALERALVEASAALGTYDRALNLLAFRARSASELRRSLVRKGESPANVDAALARLAEAGLIDDAEFARQFARSKVAGQGHSRRRLQQELFRKGVARELADDAIAEVLADESVDEREMIERAARKKLRVLGKVDGPTRRRRLYGYLARRGHEPEEIRRVMEVVLGGEVAVDGGEAGDLGEY